MSFWAEGSVILLLSCLLGNGFESLLRLAGEGYVNIVPYSPGSPSKPFQPLLVSIPGNLRAGPTG